MALSPKQQAFIEHYLACWNASEAARRAGYSEKTAKEQAARLLTNVHIQAAIQARLIELKMSADEVLTRLTEHARASLADFIDVSEPGADPSGAEDMIEAKAIVGGWRLNLLKAEQRGKLHLIKKIKSGQWGPEIEIYDAQAALNLLGRHHKLFTDQIEHSGKVDVEYVNDWRSDNPTE